MEAGVTEEATLSSDPRWLGVERVAASVAFQKSPRLRELLVFVCDRTLRTQLGDLREQAIGCAVFGRSQGYNPGEDNIVRVEIRQLRKRLAEYFESEGKDDAVVITIPKGAYVPAFEFRTVAPPPEVESEPTPDTPGEPTVAEPTPDTPGEPTVAEPTSLAPVAFLTSASNEEWANIAKSNLKRWSQPAVIVVLALVCLWLSLTGGILDHRTAPKPDVDRGPLWSLLFRDDMPTMIVCADSALVTIETILKRPVTLEEYLSGDYAANPTKLSSDAMSLLRAERAWQFTDMTDLHLVQRLYGLNSAHWSKVSVGSARTVQVQDFKTGNSILLGSVRSNLWNRLFEPSLNFQFGYDEQTKEPFIRDKAPVQNEQAMYRSAVPGASGAVYSTIALVPNLRHTGSILIIAGTSGEATEAAGEFILNRASSAGLIHTLVLEHNSHLPYFEALLKSESLDGVATNPSILATRILPDELSALK